MTNYPEDPDGRMHPGRRLHQRAQQRKEAERANHTPPPAPTSASTPAGASTSDQGAAHRYVQRAYTNELHALANTPEGSRNHQLNLAAFNLGQLVAAGHLDHDDVTTQLTHTAHTIGLDPGETAATIRSGLTEGQKHPRTLNLRPVPTHVTDVHPDTLTNPDGGGVPDPPGPDETEAFWNADRWRTHLYLTAKARRCSPWAVLGVALTRTLTLVPPAIVLPPIVGGHATLNLFIGLVGPSGAGKGAAERAATDALHTGHITTLTTGSGEGIAHAYRRRGRDGVQAVVNTAVTFSIPEIDTLSALGNRKGATLMPELRRAWSGEDLGFAYADPSKRLIVEAHTYRMTLVAGIQPARADALLDDTDGGTPQRFLWLPATDPDAPDTPPDCPAPLTWQPPPLNRPDLRGPLTSGRMVIPVCDTARDTIDAAHLARTRGEGDALDGHLLLSQLKTAAALAILSGRLEVTDADWQAADVVIRVSTATRAGVAHTLAARARARNEAVAHAEAERAEIVQERASDAAHKRVCRHVMRKLADGEPRSRSELRKSLASRDRSEFDAAIQALVDTGEVAAEGGRYGTTYRRP